jgi:hypothetical protein
MKADGTVMKLRSPVSVKEILIDYPSHGIFEAPASPRLGIANFSQPLSERAALVGGHLYYLIPLQQNELINYNNNNSKRGPFARDSSWLQPSSTATDSIRKGEEADHVIDKIHSRGGVRIFSSSYFTHGSMVRVKLRLRKEDLASFLSINNVMQNAVAPPLIQRDTRKPALSPWKPSLHTIAELHSPVGDLERSQRKLK